MLPIHAGDSSMQWGTSYRPLSSLLVPSEPRASPAAHPLPHFASVISPLLQGSGRVLSFEEVAESMPRKHLHARPHALHDGAGKLSAADWSAPRTEGKLGGLRKSFINFCLSVRADKRLVARASVPSPEPLFSQTEVEKARALVFPAIGIPAPDNPLVHPSLPADVPPCY